MGACGEAARRALRTMIGSTKIKTTAKHIANNKPRTGDQWDSMAVTCLKYGLPDRRARLAIAENLAKL
jgi:hypothetical protein